MKEQQDNPLHIIAYGLADCFKDNPEKITQWLFTANLNFGGFSPAQLMMNSERMKKVSDFVLSAQELGAGSVTKQNESEE